MNISNSRRRFLIYASYGVIGVATAPFARAASHETHLDPSDPTAKALAYVHQTPHEGKLCSNCMHISGEEGAEWRPCALFPGKLVNANGYCNAWVVKGG